MLDEIEWNSVSDQQQDTIVVTPAVANPTKFGRRVKFPNRNRELDPSITYQPFNNKNTTNPQLELRQKQLNHHNFPILWRSSYFLV